MHALKHNASPIQRDTAVERTTAHRLGTWMNRLRFVVACASALIGLNAIAADAVPSGNSVAQEFRNVQYNYYFLTNKANEKSLLLAQNTPTKTVWESTGQYVRLYANATDNSNAKGLRRFEFKSTYTGAPYSSHVYSVSAAEIALVNTQMLANVAKIVDEDNTGFVLEPESGTSGQQPSCVKGQTPVWRAFNASRFHHRYTSDFGFYTDTILANLPADTGWVKDNDEIKFCAIESAAHYSLKVETSIGGAGNTMAVKVTLTDADAVVLSAGVATTQQVRVNLQLPPELTYLSDDLLAHAKCVTQFNKAGTALSCNPNVISGGQTTFNLNLTVAPTFAPTTQKIQAIAAAATSETRVDPRQCSEVSRPSFGCAIGIAAVVNTTTKSVSFSPPSASTSAGTPAVTGLSITPTDPKSSAVSVSVFAPANVAISNELRRCGVGTVVGSGTRYTCTFDIATLTISVTPSTAGSYVLWTLIPGASVTGADACLASPTPVGCARLDLTATAPSSPVILAFSADAPLPGTVNSSYSWQYACINKSIDQTAIGVNCTQSALPNGLKSSCNNNQTTDVLPNGRVTCYVSDVPTNAGTTIFNLNASAKNASPLTEIASITINAQAVVVPPVSAAPKISDPTLNLVAGSAIQGSPNIATVNYSFTSNVAQTVYLALMEEIGGVLNYAVMTGVSPSQQFSLSAGADASGTISFSTSQSSASFRLCVLPSAPTIPVRCDNPSTRVLSASALPVNFVAPPAPAATATLAFASPPTAAIVGAPVVYTVAVTQTGATTVTLPLTVAITLPNLFSVVSASGCIASTSNSRVLNCAITAALPQSLAITVQPQPGASAAAAQLFALAIANSTGASAPFTCAGATPPSACASSNVLTPTFYDMAAQAFALPSGNVPSVMECKNVGTRATESGNLTCTVELTYEDSTTKATKVDSYQTFTPNVLVAGASLPLVRLYASGATGITTTCGNPTTPSKDTCDVLTAPPTGSTLTTVKLTTAAGGIFDGLTTDNDSKTVTATPIIVPPIGISCTDKSTDQQYVFDGNYDTNGAFSPRTFRSPEQQTASYEIIPGAYTVTAGFPARFNAFTWQWVGPAYPTAYRMTISPCRGDFTSANALKLDAPGYTPEDDTVGIVGNVSLYFDENVALRATQGGYAMSLPSNRRWYINVRNDFCSSTELPCAFIAGFKHAQR